MIRLTRILISVAVASGALPAVAQSSDPATLRQELESSQALLYELETEGDNLDPRLSEPLMQVAERYMRLGQYPEAHAAIDRGMQITRVNEGLYTPNQIPFLKIKIENYVRWNNWDPAREQMEHLYWFYRTKISIDELLADNLMDLSDMHLHGAAGDSPEYQTYHLRRAESTNRAAIIVGEMVWGEFDERLGPMFYNLVKQYHIQASALQSGGRVAYELRQTTPGSNVMRERVDTRRFFYFSGLRSLRRIQSIYEAANPPNPEGVAMATLYLADWQVLFGRNEEALNTYQRAYQGLQDAGLEADDLDLFFSRPTLVPEPEFHPTLAQALQTRFPPREALPQIQATTDTSTLFFSEWSPTFPFVRPPVQSDGGQALESNFALFSFNLAGIPDIAHWLDTSNRQGFASVQQARLVEPEPESRDQEEQLLRRVESLRFRPRLQGGVPQDSTGTLMYQLAGGLPQ